MKNARFQSIAIGLAFVSSLFFTTCKKENTVEETEQEVSFTIGSIDDGEGSSLKCAPIYSLNQVKKIVLTIQHEDGSPTNYTSSELSIHQMNNLYFFSQKIILKSGRYKLTEFLLLDSAGKTIFMIPLKGSPEANKVTNPLPYTFITSSSITNIIRIKVISTQNKQPEDFGIAGFDISESKGLTFQVAVVDFIHGGSLSAKLKIGNIDDAFPLISCPLEAITNNKITLDTSRNAYPSVGKEIFLVVSKEGYIPYYRELTTSSLEQYASMPLLVELETVKYQTGSVTDVDGNNYKTVKIGEQWWMAENLKTTHYSDGTPIHLATRQELYEWTGIGDTIRKAYIDYYYCYTWLAAMNDTSKSALSQNMIQGVCPTGWHLPAKDEWNELVDYLKNNGYGYKGTSSHIGKSVAYTEGWFDDYVIWSFGGIQETNNSTGFSGKVCPTFNASGDEGLYGYSATWWSSTVAGNQWAWGQMIFINNSELESSEFFQGYYLNVRCLKN